MGSFAVLPLADLADLLHRRQATGTLTCERGTVRKSVHLSRGRAVGASSNDPREYLGQLLVNFGHLDAEQLGKAFRTQEETKVRLGKVLTMVGLVAPETVREALAIKVRETLLDVFLWDAGLFSLDDAPPPEVDELDASVPLAEITKEAEFRATAWSAFRGEFPTGTASLEVDEVKVPAGLGPDTVDGRLLALARDGKTIDEIGLVLRVPDFHLYQRLYAFARQGVLRAAPDRASAETIAAADLVDRARGLLAEGRTGDAQLVAAKALEMAPASGAARSLLGEAERLLGERLRADLLEPPRVPRPRVVSGEIHRLALSAPERYLLSRCDGERNVRELLRLAPIRELDLLRALRRLADAELLDLV